MKSIFIVEKVSKEQLTMNLKMIGCDNLYFPPKCQPHGSAEALSKGSAPVCPEDLY